jgi:hypothetical protein
MFREYDFNLGIVPIRFLICLIELVPVPRGSKGAIPIASVYSPSLQMKPSN